ncbi:Replication protein O [Burkholderia gladioli]|uniref:Replication protein O n=1 Tax=Burkholderia gladioli TaxID=28095 RepID=UPI0016420CFA|nr:Replication protein O [Burkholderia gladioli]
MSIAQLCEVAGEGNTHTLDSATDSIALAQYTCDETNLPWIIFRAAHRAAHVPELPQRARALLAALARTVDANRPLACIFARRDTLTGRALQSLRTFYRSLDDLEKAGLITRPQQKRYSAVGKFGRSDLHLTEKAAVLLGLVQPEPQEQQQSEEGATTFEQPNATVAHGSIYKNLSPTHSQKRQAGLPPQDLMRLRGLGFYDFMIFKLMREAREAGKRLSDIVEATWPSLKLAKSPIRYLKKLIAVPTDFSAVIALRNAEANAAATEQAELAEALDVAQRVAGCTLYSPDGQVRYNVSTDGTELYIHEATEARPRNAASSWQQKFARALAAGKVIPSTPELVELFSATRRQSAMPSLHECHTEPTSKASGAVHMAGVLNLLRAKGFRTQTA